MGQEAVNVIHGIILITRQKHVQFAWQDALIVIKLIFARLVILKITLR